MNSKLLAAGVVGIVIIGIGTAFVVGIGPFPGGNDETIDDFPMATGTPYGSGDGGGGTGDGGGSNASGGDGDSTNGEPTGPAFRFNVNAIEECGETCRDVTVTLDNNREETRSDVVVYVRIFAGNGTDEGDVIWEGTEEVGSMEPGESVTRTKRVELSMTEGLAVQNNDGWITLLTTVDSTEKRVTFQERRDVA